MNTSEINVPPAEVKPVAYTEAIAALTKQASRAIRATHQPQEWKLISLRECPTPDQLQICDTPDRAAAYWRQNIPQHPLFDPECECMIVLILNTRRRVKGHCFVSTGTMDTLLIHPRSIFRLAVAASAAAIILVHNHPSGDESPSEADIRVTRDLIRAGEILRIEVLDHLVMGAEKHSSLRSMGYFTSVS